MNVIDPTLTLQAPSVSRQNTNDDLKEEQKMKQIRKITALLISLVMIISLMSATSVTTYAADTTASTYNISDATFFVFSDNGITVTEGAYGGYKIDGTSLTIKESGIYVISGSCGNGTIVV